MPMTCKVSWCKTTNRKTCLSFHTFPDQGTRRVLWCEAIGIDPKLVQIKSSTICPNHFSPDQFTTVHKIRLKKSAVPYLTNPGLIELEPSRVAHELLGNSASPSTLSSASQSYSGMSNNVIQPKDSLYNIKSVVLASRKNDPEDGGARVAHELSCNSASRSTLPSELIPLVSILSTSSKPSDEPFP